MSRSGIGCGTHLLIAFGLFVAALGVIAYQNQETVVMMWDNVTAMNEGMDLTDELRYPEDVLDYITAHPETVSLVAYDVGAKDRGIHLGADTDRPMINLDTLPLLVAYTTAVHAGTVDPNARVSLIELGQHTLPAVNQSAHERMVQQWASDGQIDTDSTVALSAVAEAVARHNDDASADWLLDKVERAATEEATEVMGLRPTARPMPRTGRYLGWVNTHESLNLADPEVRLAPDTMYAAAARYVSDTTYARDVRETFQARGSNLTLRQQQRMAQATAPRASVDDAATALLHMEAASEAPIADAYAVLDRSRGLDSLDTHLQGIASKGGAMPGVISFVGVARFEDGRPPRVVALSMEEVPLAVFYHLLQSGLDQGLALQLLGDDAFFEETAERFRETT